MISQTPITPTNAAPINLQLVKNAYERAAAGSKKSPLPFDEVLAQPADELWLRKISQYTKRLLATQEESAQGHMFINGKYYAFGGVRCAALPSSDTDCLALDSDGPIGVDQPAPLCPRTGEIFCVHQHAIPLSTQLAIGIVPNDISTFFYDLPSVPTRRSKLIVPDSADNKLRIFNILDVFSIDLITLNGKIASDFVYSNDASRGAPITMWVVGDLDSREGRRVTKDALRHLQVGRCYSLADQA